MAPLIRLLLLALAAAVALPGCDGGPSAPPPSEPPAPAPPGPLGSAAYTLRALGVHVGASSAGQGVPVPARACFVRHAGASSNLLISGGVMRFEGARFSLAVAGEWTPRPYTPEPLRDTLRAEGTYERYGPLLLLRTVEGDTAFAAIGPDPERPSTLTVSDPSDRLLYQGREYGAGQAGGCGTFRFAAEGFAPEPEVPVGPGEPGAYRMEAVSRAWAASGEGEWAPLPYRTYGSRVGLYYVTSGQLQLSAWGGYSLSGSWARFSGGGGGPDGTGAFTSGGSHRAALPLVLLDVGTAWAAYGMVRGGRLVVYGSRFRVGVGPPYGNSVPYWPSDGSLNVRFGP